VSCNKLTWQFAFSGHLPVSTRGFCGAAGSSVPSSVKISCNWKNSSRCLLMVCHLLKNPQCTCSSSKLWFQSKRNNVVVTVLEGLTGNVAPTVPAREANRLLQCYIRLKSPLSRFGSTVDEMTARTMSADLGPQNQTKVSVYLNLRACGCSGIDVRCACS
jgi:hypothetical protein